MSLHREDPLVGCFESCTASRAFKREKLHQKPARDVTFGSIRATSRQACPKSSAARGERWCSLRTGRRWRPCSNGRPANRERLACPYSNGNHSELPAIAGPAILQKCAI